MSLCDEFLNVPQICQETFLLFIGKSYPHFIPIIMILVLLLLSFPCCYLLQDFGNLENTAKFDEISCLKDNSPVEIHFRLFEIYDLNFMSPKQISLVL